MSTIATSPRESTPPPDAETQPAPPPPDEAGRRVARNLGALLGGQAITWTVTLAWTVVVPRALGPVGLGILVSAQSVSGVLGIVLGMGTRNYLVREAVVNPAEGPKLVGTALILRIATAPVVGVAAVIWARVAGDGHRAATVLYLITAMTVLTLITEPLQAAFQAIERMKYLAYADVINKTAQSLIGIALVLVGFNVVGIAANMTIISVVVLVLTFWWLRPHFAIDIRTSAARMLHMSRESISYWAFGLFGMVYFWIDTIMLSLMTRPQVVGWYGITSQLFQTLMFLPVLVQTAWLPRLVAAFASGHRQLTEAARTPVELILTISVPIAVAMGLVADPLIHTVYGAGFAHAVPVMVILAFCIPPIYLNIVLASVLLAAKRQRVWTIVMGGAAVINPLFNLALIPWTEHRYHNGAIGAAISLVATEVLMDLIGFGLVGRHVFDRRSVRRCAAAVLASSGMIAAAYVLRPLGPVVALAAGFTAFGLLALALGVVRRQELVTARLELAQFRRGRDAPVQAAPAATAPNTTGLPAVEGIDAPPSPPAPPVEPAPARARNGYAGERPARAGDVSAALATAQRLELGELLDRNPCRERDLCLAVILGRVVGAGARLGTLDALSQATLADELGLVGVTERDLNLALDWLLERQAEIEGRLASRHLTAGVPAVYGAVSRDVDVHLLSPRHSAASGTQERHCAQLAYWLLCDVDGRPVAIEPRVGRPGKGKSLRSQIAIRKRLFGLSGIVVVARPELLTQPRIEELPATAGIHWITALSAPTLKKLARTQTAELTGPDGARLWEISGVASLAGDERLIGCRSLTVAARAARKRDGLLSATEADLAEIAERVDCGVLRGADRIWLEVGPVLNRHRMRRYLQVEIGSDSVSYARDDDRLAAAAALDGLTVLRTSVASSALATADLARIHDSVGRAETSLGSLEDPDLERLRIHRPPEDRARCNAWISMLAYYVTWHLRIEPPATRATVDPGRAGSEREC